MTRFMKNKLKNKIKDVPFLFTCSIQRFKFTW